MTEALTDSNYTPDFEVLYPDIKAAQTTDRIKVIRFGDPYSGPGTCVVCRCTLTPDKEFIDFGLDIEFYGVIYVCTICMADVFSLARFISVDGEYHRKLFAGYKAAVEEVGKLRQELTKVRTEVVENVISRISDYMRDIDTSDLANSFTMAGLSEAPSKNVQLASSGTTENVEANGDERAPDASVDKQGSDDIFDLTNIDEFKFDNFKF